MSITPHVIIKLLGVCRRKIMILVHAGSWISLEFLINMLRELAQRDQRSQTLSQLLLALFIWSHCVCSALGGENYADIRLTKLDDDGFAFKKCGLFSLFCLHNFFRKINRSNYWKTRFKIVGSTFIILQTTALSAFFQFIESFLFFKILALTRFAK